MKKYFLVFLFFLSLFILSAPQITHAQGILKSGNISSCVEDGSCKPDQIIDLVDNIVRWGAAVAGAIALFMYILGGVWMIFSAGASSRVERGKNIITGTTVSLIFILGSWLIIDFTLTALSTKNLELEATTCGGETCDPIYQFCDNGTKCVDICVRDHESDASIGFQWECTNDFCGFADRDACANSPETCELNKCPGGADIVCCVEVLT